MGGQKPRFIITDQDPAMKVAISRLFDTSTHRFCMWHILRKVSEKVGPLLNKNEAFFDKLKNCVWKSESPDEFESSWTSLISEFDLSRNEWFSDMFSLREMWIPAYFKDLFLVGILRTTSGSESENSFFNRFTNRNLSFVEFWMSFEHAIESQRHGERAEDNNNKACNPLLKTELDIEKHAREVFTHANFYVFQDQLLSACFHCGVQEIKNLGDGHSTFVIFDMRSGKTRQVLINDISHEGSCSCKFFESGGLPCCHILTILKGKALKKIPSFYIVNRWTKLATKIPLSCSDAVLLNSSTRNHDQAKKMADLWSRLFHCMHLASQSEIVLDFVGVEIMSLEKKLTGMNFEASCTSSSKEKDVEMYLGSTIPEEVRVHPPNPVSTKGSRKRIKSGKEIAIQHDDKNKRRV